MDASVLRVCRVQDWIYALKSLPASTIFTRIQSHLLWNTVR